MFSRLAPSDHACLTYDGPEDLLAYLDVFTTEGLDSGRLTLFVHSLTSDDEAMGFLDAGQVDYRDLLGTEFFLVSHHEAAFQGDAPHIDFAHVDHVLTDLTERAKDAAGGLGIFVDASRRYIAEGRDEEWFRFEEWLGTRLRYAVGLVCAHRNVDLADPGVRARMLRSHLYRFG